LYVGGRFCGQLSGERDFWAIYPNRTHHTLPDVMERLNPFIIECLEVEKHPRVTTLNEEKYWQIFHIVACKQAECSPEN
jgi:tellurite methyltransferase